MPTPTTETYQTSLREEQEEEESHKTNIQPGPPQLWDSDEYTTDIQLCLGQAALHFKTHMTKIFTHFVK